MRIYSGWKFDHDGREYTINGSIKLRGHQYYLLLRDDSAKSSIHRQVLLKWFNDGKVVFK